MADFQTLLTLANVLAIGFGIYLNFRRQAITDKTAADKLRRDAYQILNEDYQRMLAERNDLLMKIDKCEQEKEMLQDLLKRRRRKP